jgi:hypothetical protein
MMIPKLLDLFIVSSLAGNIIDRRDFLSSSSFLVSSNTISSTNSNNGKEEGSSNNSSSNGNINENYMRKDMADTSQWKLTLPLERFSGGTNCIRISIPGQPKKVGRKIIRPKRIYRTIVDTGSPYLVIPTEYEDDTGISPYYFNTILEDLSSTLDHNYEPLSWIWENIQRNEAFDYFLNNLLSLPFLDTYGDDLDVPFELDGSSYDPTEDVYGSQLGLIEWKQSPITVRDNRLVPLQNKGIDTSTSTGTNDTATTKRNESNPKVVLGVLDKSLTRESGGPLVGLVKRSNLASDKVKLRPTFLDQVRLRPLTTDRQEEEREITSFQIDSPNKQLTLSAQKGVSLIPDNQPDIIELVDLRLLGDFVEHYAFIVDDLLLNDGKKDYTLTSKRLSGTIPRPIVAVFDTGLTGCLFTQPLWDAVIEKTGVTNPADFKSVEILKSGHPNTKHISIQSDLSKNPFYYLSSIELDWFDDEDSAPFVVVLGQTFLAQGILTIDIEDRRANFQLP